MKANSKFGKVTLISRTENGNINLVTESGEAKTIMTAFVKLTDDNNNVITDFSALPTETKISINKSEKKDSTLRTVMSGLAIQHENNGERFNKLTSTWE